MPYAGELGAAVARAFGLRVPVVLGTTLVVLAMLFAMQALYVRRSLESPMRAAVSAVSGVVRATVAPSGSAMRVDVWLGPVANLSTAYAQVESAVTSAAPGTQVDIYVHDNRTPALLNDYYALNAIIEQGRVTGQFVAMQRELQAEAAKLGLTRAQVIVGNAQMFVELVSGRHYLYDILPLNAATTGSAG